MVSIGAILPSRDSRGVAGSNRTTIVGCSPIIGEAVAAAWPCLSVIGVDSTAAAVGRHYGAVPPGYWTAGWCDGDHAEIDGVAVRSAPLRDRPERG